MTLHGSEDPGKEDLSGNSSLVAFPSPYAYYYFSEPFTTLFKWLLLLLGQTGLAIRKKRRENLFAQELNIGSWVSGI